MNEDFGLPQEEQKASPQDEIAALKAQLAAKDLELLKAQVATLQAQTATPGLFKPVGPDDAPTDEGIGPVDTKGFPKKYVKLKIFRGQNAQDLDYVPVGVNGYTIKITRDVEVIVPHVFAEVLDHCVEDITIKAEGGLITRPSHRFPYSLLGDATEEEYLAFQAKMKLANAPVRTLAA